METIEAKTIRYRAIIRELLAQWAAIPHLEKGIRERTLFDEQNDRYAVIAEGWLEVERVLDIILDLEIVNGKVWIQADNTDVAIARKLEAQGIPKSDIVLGFRSPATRAETEYAVA
jgi:XisI protein